MIPVFSSLARALYSQLHGRMLLLTILPFIAAVLIWGGLLWVGLQPLIDMLYSWFSDYDLFRSSGQLLDKIGLTGLKTLLVPLLAMWLLLPLMILTALGLVGFIAMPSITRHVSSRFYPQLDARQGGSFAGTLWVSFSAFALFLLVWLITLPLNLIPLAAPLIQPLLWGWLASRVMSYDALANHADEEERKKILQDHRIPLLVIGIVTGVMGALPGLMWLGGVMSVIFFPILAAAAIWLYLLVFVFSGLWFEHYCLAALAKLRESSAMHAASPRIIDLN